MNNTKTKYILATVSVFIAFGLGYFATPNKQSIKEVVKTVIQKEEAKDRIVYRDRVISPDGTVTEHEEEHEHTDTKETSNTVVKTDVTITKDVGLTISALAVAPIKDIGGDREYALVVSKRVIGALNVTAEVTTDKKIGLGLGWSF